MVTVTICAAVLLTFLFVDVPVLDHDVNDVADLLAVARHLG